MIDSPYFWGWALSTALCLGALVFGYYLGRFVGQVEQLGAPGRNPPRIHCRGPFFVIHLGLWWWVCEEGADGEPDPIDKCAMSTTARRKVDELYEAWNR